MPFVTLNTEDMMVPVLVPRTSPVAVSGWDSMWVVGGLIASALISAWSFVRVSPQAKAAKAASKKKRYTRKGAKKKSGRR